MVTSGVWNLFEEIGSAAQRQEILDWYHLKENLYKIGGSLKRLQAAETFLWRGQIESAIALFIDLKKSLPKTSSTTSKSIQNELLITSIFLNQAYVLSVLALLNLLLNRSLSV